LGFDGFKVYAWLSDEYNETLFKEAQKWAKGTPLHGFLICCFGIFFPLFEFSE
jgi:hypothetical protein